MNYQKPLAPKPIEVYSPRNRAKVSSLIKDKYFAGYIADENNNYDQPETQRMLLQQTTIHIRDYTQNNS